MNLALHQYVCCAFYLSLFFCSFVYFVLFIFASFYFILFYYFSILDSVCVLMKANRKKGMDLVG